jgi:NADH-quinone oxidoreductase subunit I
VLKTHELFDAGRGFTLPGKKMGSVLEETAQTLAGIAKGLKVTLSEMLSPAVTEEYPDGPPHFEGRYRGVHVLQRDANGLEKCVACFLCAAACPANCIYIEAAENTERERFSASERYAKVYDIDYNRCIFCGYCVEACPTDAIIHGHGFEIADYNTCALIYRKEQLLAPLPAISAQDATTLAALAAEDSNTELSEAA